MRISTSIIFRPVLFNNKALDKTKRKEAGRKNCMERRIKPIGLPTYHYH